MGRLATVFLLYLIPGATVLWLAIHPGYASPWFPSAGVALAAVVRFGPQVLPAVGLASAVLNIAVGIHNGTPFSLIAVSTALIPAGAMLQAWLGAKMLARYAPLRLDSPGQVLRLTLGAGAVCSMISATVGTATLHGLLLRHTGSWSQVAYSWSNWWLGDALGVIIVTPIMLALAWGEPRDLWRSRRIALALGMSTLMIAMGFAIYLVTDSERERQTADFKRAATAIHQRLDARVVEYLHALHGLNGLFVSSNDVSRAEFRLWAKEWMSEFPRMQALGWYRRLDASTLSSFEREVAAELAQPFSVFDRLPDGQRTPPAKASNYLVLTYIEPMDRNAKALGLNARSVPEATAAIDAAYRSGKPAASGGFRLTQETASQVGVVIYQRIGWASATGADAHRDLGVVFVTMRMDDIVQGILGDDDSHAEVCIFDRTPDARIKHLAGGASCERPTAIDDVVTATPIEFAGRQWSLRVRQPLERFPALWSPWTFAAIGLTAVALFNALLLLVTGQAWRISDVVRKRTLELEQEIVRGKQSADALYQSEQLLRNVLSSAPVGITYCDRSGRYYGVNPCFEHLVGYTFDELKQMTFIDITHPDDVGIDLDLGAQLWAGELGLAEYDKRYVRKDGQHIWTHLRVTMLRDANDQPHSLLAIVEDITNRMQLREVERARDQAEAANLAKNEFLSRMSHELRTPLNAILGFAQLLSTDTRQPLPTPQRAMVDDIQRAGWHLLDMINDVLDLSRIEAGTIRLSIEPVRLRPIVEECLSMLAREAREHDVHIETQFAAGVEFVLGDQLRLKQIVTNLLSNAIKYNRRQGRIQIHIAPLSDNHVVLSITDSGLGMSRAQLDQLFQPFNRLGREQGAAQGTGIGLVITRMLVELLGGQLQVSSEPGQGSRFEITLRTVAQAPVKASAEPGPHAERPIAAAPLPAPMVCAGKRQILYIEDNALNADVMRGVMDSRPDVELTIAATGAEGLAKLDAARPDLLLLDLNLPDARGMDILKRLRATPATADLPIVIVSANALGSQINDALAAGATGYVTKPLRTQQILDLIERLLGSGNARG